LQLDPNILTKYADQEFEQQERENTWNKGVGVRLKGIITTIAISI
jgi:hypothetical protein